MRRVDFSIRHAALVVDQRADDFAAPLRRGADAFLVDPGLRALLAQTGGEVPVIVQELRPSRSSIAKRIPRTMANLVKLRIYLWRDK